jgi:hypothetical protein
MVLTRAAYRLIINPIKIISLFAALSARLHIILGPRVAVIKGFVKIHSQWYLINGFLSMVFIVGQYTKIY